MAETTPAAATRAEVMAELAALADPKTLAVNEKHGDDHGVNLGKLRALAKRLKTQQELARQLWTTGDSAARLAWFADQDPVVASAGWALTTDRVVTKSDDLDLEGLLDLIERRMKDAPERLQWAMNHCLAQIGSSVLSTVPGPSRSVSALRCSRTTRRSPTAPPRTRRSGSPSWSVGNPGSRALSRPRGLQYIPSWFMLYT